MDTLEELKYYCDEPQSVGALMLTGEWGCGKTYLLNNSLSNVLKDKCVFLRVSLFGMASIEEVKKEVKQCWLRTVAELLQRLDGLKRLKSILEFLRQLRIKVLNTFQSLGKAL